MKENSTHDCHSLSTYCTSSIVPAILQDITVILKTVLEVLEQSSSPRMR